ncbi:hypothetical protein [Sedimenticola hydrogenitrophicus]|uniref:hypothetical protein n=1 Tax=Sedimenticola hydrogenitrophicus TaxID=2967975 RepID=UPI0023B1EF4B|nr:hypothetical protein [Sedimenticola hydrogenitrophicus]
MKKKISFDEAIMWIESLGMSVYQQPDRIDRILDQLCGECHDKEACPFKDQTSYWRGFAAGATGISPLNPSVMNNSDTWFQGFGESRKTKSLLFSDDR